MPEQSRFELFVPGLPQPQGSKDYKGLRHGKPILVESNARVLGPWRDKIQVQTMAYVQGRALQMPVQLESIFYLPRPAFHFGSGKNAHQLVPSAPPYPDVIPDLDKLLRALCDGLAKGGAMRNDSQIIVHLTCKFYADGGQRPGVHLILQSYPGPFIVPSMMPRSLIEFI